MPKEKKEETATPSKKRDALPKFEAPETTSQKRRRRRKKAKALAQDALASQDQSAEAYIRSLVALSDEREPPSPPPVQPMEMEVAAATEIPVVATPVPPAEEKVVPTPPAFLNPSASVEEDSRGFVKALEKLQWLPESTRQMAVNLLLRQEEINFLGRQTAFLQQQLQLQAIQPLPLAAVYTRPELRTPSSQASTGKRTISPQDPLASDASAVGEPSPAENK